MTKNMKNDRLVDRGSSATGDEPNVTRIARGRFGFQHNDTFAAEQFENFGRIV